MVLCTLQSWCTRCLSPSFVLGGSSSGRIAHKKNVFSCLPWLQVARLSRLCNLQLVMPDDYEAASLMPLSHLCSTLTRLTLVNCEPPFCLSMLTRLQQLELTFTNDLDNGAVGAALPHLQQLTCLVGVSGRAAAPVRCHSHKLCTTGICFTGIVQVHARHCAPLINRLTSCTLPAPPQLLRGFETPASLAGLPRLQRCLLGAASAAAGGLEPLPLPSGPWLRSLRWLSVDIHILVSTVAVLRHAEALERLEVGEPEYQQHFNWRPPAVTALFDWLAQHPPLKSTCFGCRFPIRHSSTSIFDSPAFDKRLDLLARRRPDLELRRLGTAAGVQTFFDCMREQ